MSAQPVRPPIVGTSSAEKTAPLAWIGLKVESACQPSLPLRIFTTSSPSASSRKVPSSRTLLTAPISNPSAIIAPGWRDLFTVLLQELAGKDEKRVLEPGVVQRTPRRLVEIGKPDPGDHRTEGRVDRLDVE